MLDLPLTDSEAAALVEPLAGLHRLVRAIEMVPLPYCADPFISPRCGEDWLESWPER